MRYSYRNLRVVGASMLGLGLAFVVMAVAGSVRAEDSYREIVDARTGIRLSLPLEFLATETATRRGTNWSTRDKAINIDALTYPEDQSLRRLYDNLKGVRGRKLEQERWSEGALTLAGRDQDGSRFHVELRRQGSKIRGYSLVYALRATDTATRILERLVQHFDAFPETIAESTRTEPHKQAASKPPGQPLPQAGLVTVEPNIGDFSVAKAFYLSPDEKLLAVNEFSQISLWDIASGRRLRTLRTTAYIAAASFMPDGRKFVTAHKDGSLLFWDIETGELVGRILYGRPGQSAEIRSLSVGPLGTVAVALSVDEGPGSTGSIVSIVDGRQRREVNRLTRLRPPYSAQRLSGDAIRVSYDEKYVYSVSDGILSVWALPGAQKVVSRDVGTKVRRGGESLLRVAGDGLLGDGTLLYTESAIATRHARGLSYCRHGALHSLDLKAGDAVPVALDGAPQCNDPAGSNETAWTLSDSVSIIARDSDRTFFVSREGVSGLKMGGARSRTLASTASWATPELGRLVSIGESLAVFANKKQVHVRRLSDGTLIANLGTPMYRAEYAFASDGGRTVALFQGNARSGDRHSQLMIWHVEGVNPVFFRWQLNEKFTITDGAFGAGLAVGVDENDNVVLISTRTGSVTRRFRLRWQKALRHLRISPDGRLVAVVGELVPNGDTAGESAQQAVIVAALDGATKADLMAGATEQIRAIAFSSDSRLLAVSRSDESVEIWSMETFEKLATMGPPEGHKEEGTRVIVFSQDGRFLLGGTTYGGGLLWDITGRRFLRVLARGGDSMAHHVMMSSLAISSDGSQIAAGFVSRAFSSGDTGSDEKVLVWDGRTGAHQLELRGHDGGIRGLAFSPNELWLVSGSYDGTIRYWDRTSGKSVATVSAKADGRWSIVTNKGFFAGTPSAARLLSVARRLQVTGIDQVWQSLFNPDLVREYLSGDKQGEVAAAERILDVNKVLDSAPAPSVTILQPTAETSVRDIIDVTIRATDNGKGIGRVEWRVNGVTAAVVTGPSGQGPDYTMSRQLALDPGDNVIEVVAYNAANLLASLPARATIRLEGVTDEAKPKLHVLDIGINAYIDKGWTPPGKTALLKFPPLNLAVKDATALATALKQAGVDQYSEVKVTQALDRDATLAGLETIIDRMATDIHPRDTFVLFAAAHGTSLNGRFYMIPQDYDGGINPEALRARAVGQDRLQDWVANRIKAKRAIVLLDTCESGALVGGYTRSRTDVPASEAAIGRLHEATGRPVLTAAAEGKPAFEGYQGHGVFTWAILDALKNGDRNANGTIELSELVAHVQDQVPKIAAKLNGRGSTTVAARGSAGERQSARFGSRGEDFAVVRRLQ